MKIQLSKGIYSFNRCGCAKMHERITNGRETVKVLSHSSFIAFDLIRGDKLVCGMK